MQHNLNAILWNMKATQTLIFDFDGTIVNTMPQLFAIINGIAKDYRFKRVRKRDLTTFRDLSTRDVIKALDISMVKAPFIMHAIRKKLSDKTSDMALISGMGETLMRLHSMGFDLYILTSNSIENVTAVLSRFKLDCFKGIYSKVGLFGKATALNDLMRLYTIDKQSACYIGDEVRDIEACQKVGLDMIAVSWGFASFQALIQYNPTYLVQTPLQLMQQLEQLQAK